MSRCLTCTHYRELPDPIQGPSLLYTGLCSAPAFVATGKGNLCAKTIGFASLCRFHQPKDAKKEEAA